MRFFLLILICYSCKTSNPVLVSQKNILNQSQRKIKTLPKQVEVDKLGNIYVYNVFNELTIYNSSGNTKYHYTDSRLGNIEYFDVSNPLKILVYHRDFNIIKFLDNTLAISDVISLNKSAKITSATLAATSNDGNTWIFDALSQKLYKVNSDLNIIVESNRFSDLGIANFKPKKMIERNNILVVSGDNGGFMIFDNFGQLIKNIPGQEINDFQFDGNNILYLSNTDLKNQPMDYPDYTSIDLPPNVKMDELIKVRYENNSWYLVYTDGIDIIERSNKR